jgi:chromosome segregation ATPase
MAVVLILAAAVLVGTALVVAVPLLTSLAAVVAVLCGAGATRITHTELVSSRRRAAADRAHQSQTFTALSQARTTENTRFIDGMNANLARQQQAVGQLEDALCAAQHRAAEATRSLQAEQARAEQEGLDYERKLVETQEHAATATARVTELEQERDVLRGELEAIRAEQEVLRSELDAWQIVGSQPFRRHA